MTLPQLRCYRHADRAAGVSCQRCERPICPDCMIAGSVGFHCPNCANANVQRVVTPAARWGAGSTMTRPVATIALIVINVLVYVAGLSQPGGGFEAGLIGRGLSATGYVGVAEGEWWRLVTGGFLHAGTLHLAFNMFALWNLGEALERALGSARFVGAYLASLLAGSAGVMLLDPDRYTVGASGAVFGLFGVLLALQLSRGIPLRQTGLGLSLAINLAITFVIPNISIGGHLGGLAGGSLVGFAFFGLPRSPRRPSGSLGWLVMASVAVCSVAASVLLAGRPPLF